MIRDKIIDHNRYLCRKELDTHPIHYLFGPCGNYADTATRRAFLHKYDSSRLLRITRQLIVFSEGVTEGQRMFLVGVYSPYLVIPLILMGYMVLNPQPFERKAKRA
jgi:hypothetical protein